MRTDDEFSIFFWSGLYLVVSCNTAQSTLGVRDINKILGGTFHSTTLPRMETRSFRAGCTVCEF